MSLSFNNYRLENVYLKTTAGQRAGIAGFWLREKAIADPREAERRAHEVVFMICRADTGELAGVSTVGFTRTGGNRIYYAYRMFLGENDRVPYLMRAVTNATRDFLRDFEHPESEPKGMLIVTENPKLMRKGMWRTFERHGYQYLGKNRRGLDLWMVKFADMDAATPFPAMK